MELQKIYKDTDFSNAEIPEGQILTYIGTDDSGKFTTKFKDNEGNYGTIAGSGGSSEVNVILGQINAEGKFQPLSFSGQEASNNGSPEVIENYYGFNGVLPVPESGGSSNGGDYYKCASVDTDNKTWTGYKAVLTDGVYSFEETVTEGLPYGTAYTPLINGIYNDEATINIAGIWQGVPLADVFKADLIDDTGASATLSMQGNITFGSKGGKQCAIFDGSSCLYNRTLTIPVPFTLSLSLYWQDTQPVIGMGPFSPMSDIELMLKDGVPTLFTKDYDPEHLYGNVNIRNRWSHVVVTYDGQERQIYIDKTLDATGNLGDVSPTGLVIGSVFSGSVDGFRDGYMTGGMRYVRIFNRVLTQDEINQLYIEQM
jgi:hypothetical protein